MPSDGSGDRREAGSCLLNSCRMVGASWSWPSHQPRPQATVRRYQRQNSGELLHLDIKKLGRFELTGTGSQGHGITKETQLGSGMGLSACSQRRCNAAGLCRGPDRRNLPVQHRFSDPGAMLVQGERRQGRTGHDRQRLRLYCHTAPTHPQAPCHPSHKNPAYSPKTNVEARPAKMARSQNAPFRL